MLIPLEGQILPVGKWCKRKIEFKCSCGGTTTIPWRRYKGFGVAKTCGKCKVKSIDPSILGKYGKLTCMSKDRISKGSHRKVLWLCDCGRTKLIRSSHVLYGFQQSCGDCNLVDAEWWSGKTFGKLKILCPISTHLGSEKKVKWLCICGSTTESQICAVVSGKTKSCGYCSVLVKIWYNENKSLLKALKYPIHPRDMPSGGIVLLDIAYKSLIPVNVICAACKSVYCTRFGDIKQGRALTCGCSTNRISSGHLEVKEFICSLGAHAILEYPLGGYKFDIYVPSKHMLIEFNGLKWHNKEKVRIKDVKKREMAESSGYLFVTITDLEWAKNRDDVKNSLKKILIVE